MKISIELFYHKIYVSAQNSLAFCKIHPKHMNSLVALSNSSIEELHCTHAPFSLWNRPSMEYNIILDKTTSITIILINNYFYRYYGYVSLHDTNLKLC